MITHLHILTGPLSGYKLRLEAGFTLGRKSATYNIKDPKTSEIHCVVAEKNGKLFLFDNDSKNGLWEQQERVELIELKHRQRIRIGRTQMEVRQRARSAIDQLPQEQRDWSNIIHTVCDELSTKIENPKPDQLLALSPPLRLSFTQGLQAKTSWTLAYGPRSVGTASTDLNIFQAGAPQECFQIIPNSKGNIFSTSHKDIVKLNGQSITSSLLKNGDVITILDTQINVELFQ